MERIEMWLWWVIDPVTGKQRRTRYRMTEEEARQRFPEGAERIEGTLEVREVPDEPNRTGAFLRRR